jgi:multicomponent Na+:H+ antiporter subunit E
MATPKNKDTAQAHRPMGHETVSWSFVASLKSLLFFAALWWLLTKGDVSSWVIGIIVVPFSAWLSIILFKDIRLRKNLPAHSVGQVQRIYVLRLFYFLPFFLLKSILGGWQTAKLAIRPSMPVNPGFFRYNLRLQGSFARLFFMHLVSLLPGTVSAKLEDDQLLIHALDMTSKNNDEISQCEQQVAKLFSGESIQLSTHANNLGELP